MSWEAWQYFYSNHDPVAITLFGHDIRWYALMYVLSLLSAYLVGRYLVVKDKYPITLEQYDRAFIWIEVGVVLGARMGYVLFYDENPLYYLSQPWQMFNPVVNGEFVGISGLSYHGAIIGFLIAAYWFCKREGIKFPLLMDLTVIASAAGFAFGRIGNFLNMRLVGRETDYPWGVYVDGVLRHPALLYEAFLEGILVFIILYTLRRFKQFDGQLMMMYGMLYGMARFTAEFFRQPDPQLGFVLWGWVTMGQILSAAMWLVALGGYLWFREQSKKTQSIA